VVPVFLGTHTPRLDDKGRLALPARFRPELEGGLVLCKGQDHCLYVFSVTEFDRFTEALRQAPITDVKVRNYGRHLFAGASHEAPDSQGRITIPPHLRDYAGLSKDCAVIGANTRLEIWDNEAWQQYLAGTEQDYADVAEEVLPGLF
jgi:MraZ protein